MDLLSIVYQGIATDPWKHRRAGRVKQSNAGYVASVSQEQVGPHEDGILHSRWEPAQGDARTLPPSTNIRPVSSDRSRLPSMNGGVFHPVGDVAGEQLSGLLRLRASPPAVSAGFVARPRLGDRLTAAAGHPLTLVSAGPGYGKTLTLAWWSPLRGGPGPVAWLSVDQSDNDLQAFWSDVLGALV